MRWPGIQELYGPALRKSKVFGPKGTAGVDAGDIEEEDKFAQGDKRWEELHQRVVEHVRTVISLSFRLSMATCTERPHHRALLHPNHLGTLSGAPRPVGGRDRGHAGQAGVEQNGLRQDRPAEQAGLVRAAQVDRADLERLELRRVEAHGALHLVCGGVG
jgi:hypothetical protein